MFKLVYADKSGKVYDDARYGAVCRTGQLYVEPTAEEFIPMPEGASLVALPGRAPIALDSKGNMVMYARAGAQAVAALLPQGYLRTLLPAYMRIDDVLPLFGYTAVAWREGQFWVAASAVASEGDLLRWDPSAFNTADLRALVEKRAQEFPHNRVLAQLTHCSLEYGCFTAQNMVYRRFEAGLPISPVCNANCVGCISLQPAECCPSPQSRIGFIPTVEECVELAVAHLTGGGDTVSFGQGCEGEPLVQGELAAEIIRSVRSRTEHGKINANTNAGNFVGVKGVVDAGIDSLRVSLNSPRDEFYNAYYRQLGYSFSDVVRSIKYAREHDVYVSINLLVLPGVSDRAEEIEAIISFIEDTGVNQVQFRNLNIDPDVYLRLSPKELGEPLGMLALVDAVRETGVALR